MQLTLRGCIESLIKTFIIDHKFIPLENRNRFNCSSKFPSKKLDLTLISAMDWENIHHFRFIPTWIIAKRRAILEGAPLIQKDFKLKNFRSFLSYSLCDGSLKDSCRSIRKRALEYVSEMSNFLVFFSFPIFQLIFTCFARFKKRPLYPGKVFN